MTTFEIYERLPFDKYRQLPGLHASSLKHALVSPLQYQHAELNDWPDNDTFRAGRAAHTAILEPNRFLAEYAQWETERADGTKRIRRGNEWDEFQAVNAGKTILTPKQYETAVELRDIVRDHPVAGPLVKGVGRNELSLRWKHPTKGVDCKGRIDRATASAIIDIKTTNDPGPNAFGRIAANLKYAMQCAFYRAGAEACGLGRLPFKIIAVGSKAPHDVVVYDVGEDILLQGLDDCERAIDLVIACREKQSWPGQAVDHALPLLLPAWAMPTDAELTMDGESIF
jgi:hypothetical protein